MRNKLAHPGTTDWSPGYRSNFAARNITTVKSTVDANGRNMLRPNRLNRISPGKRPRPSFSSHGKKADSTIRATKIVNTQRIIVAPRTDLRSVSLPTPPSHRAQASLSLSLDCTGVRRVRAFLVGQSDSSGKIHCPTAGDSCRFWHSGRASSCACPPQEP